MKLIEMHYKGAMANDARLDHAREVLATLKKEKSAKKAGVWRDSDSDMMFLLKHLAEEVVELIRDISADNITGTLGEVADVSNMADIIAVLAIEREKSMWLPNKDPFHTQTPHVLVGPERHRL
jgi:hypothetical protein